MVELAGHKKDGKLKLYNRARLDDYIARQPEGQRLVVKVSRETRSGRQHRYYWGVVLKTIANANGDAVDYLHELFKKEFLGQECKETFGRMVWKSRSTTSLDTQEFAEYIEQIRAFVADFGIFVPEPGREEGL